MELGSEKSLNPLEAAQRFVNCVYPNCSVAILAGSVVQGGATPASDLDLIIFDDSFADPHRKTYVKFGWIIEAFVLTSSAYPFFLMAAVESGIPSLMRMCTEGTIIRDDGSAAERIRSAKQSLDDGPLPLLENERDKFRYEITESLMDLEGCGNRAERLFIVSKLTDLVHRFYLRANGEWIGDGKWVYRTLRQYDEPFCLAFVSALESFYRKDDVAPFMRFVRDAVLEPHGGMLVEGYGEGFIEDDL